MCEVLCYLLSVIRQMRCRCVLGLFLVRLLKRTVLTWAL